MPSTTPSMIPWAMPGAVAGGGYQGSPDQGCRRGVFSNEAGLGSAPMVTPPLSQITQPARAFYGLFEVFMDHSLFAPSPASAS
jgi:Na+/alanine symporter